MFFSTTCCTRNFILEVRHENQGLGGCEIFAVELWLCTPRAGRDHLQREVVCSHLLWDWTGTWTWTEYSSLQGWIPAPASSESEVHRKAKNQTKCEILVAMICFLFTPALSHLLSGQHRNWAQSCAEYLSLMQYPPQLHLSSWKRWMRICAKITQWEQFKNSQLFLCSFPLAGAWYLTSNTSWASFSYPVSSSAASIILQIVEVNLCRIHSNWVLWKCTASRLCLLLGRQGLQAEQLICAAFITAQCHGNHWHGTADLCTQDSPEDCWKQDSGPPPGCWKGLKLTTSTVCFSGSLAIGQVSADCITIKKKKKKFIVVQQPITRPTASL